MDKRILFVDDELNVLEGYQRQFRRVFDITTAPSGAKGLEIITGAGPFAVVVSDFKMPGMNGIEFLSRVRELAPDTVRIMLTGFAEIQAIIEAINEGNVYRFLTKPCPSDLMVKAINEGLKQYQLITGEKELLEKTLKGTIQVLTEVLSLVNPEAFGRASRITRYVREIADQMSTVQQSDLWILETAAMLSQIGCILLPQEAIRKLFQGKHLTAEEFQIFQMHPGIGYDLLSKIPRLEAVAEIILYQEKGFDGSNIPLDSRKGEAIPLGARILKAVLDFDLLLANSETRGKALLQLKNKPGLYDPQVLKAFENVLGLEAQFELRSLSIEELKEKMILAEDMVNQENTKKILAKGHEITPFILGHLGTYKNIFGIKEPIQVLVPVTLA
jgi:response regulator RpfG family c-di-GMP phosphodiesterase